MKVDGSCHCGAIAYEAEVDPDSVTLCHCTDCQQLSGSAFRTVVRTQVGTFRVTKGTPTIYIKTTADSGTKREQGFCATCGSSIYATSVGEGPKIYGLRIGTVRQRAALKPGIQIWTRSALPWVDAIDALPAAEGQQ